jgi:hypothetical protein
MILIYWDGTPVGIIQADGNSPEWTRLEPQVRALEKKLEEEQPADYNVDDLMALIESETKTPCSRITGEFTLIP